MVLHRWVGVFRGVSKYDDTRSVALEEDGAVVEAVLSMLSIRGDGGYFETDVDCRIVQILGSLVIAKGDYFYRLVDTVSSKLLTYYSLSVCRKRNRSMSDAFTI